MYHVGIEKFELFKLLISAIFSTKFYELSLLGLQDFNAVIMVT